jgi:hypothetical protein
LAEKGVLDCDRIVVQVTQVVEYSIRVGTLIIVCTVEETAKLIANGQLLVAETSIGRFVGTVQVKVEGAG